MKILAIPGTVSLTSPAAWLLRASGRVAPVGTTVTLFEGMAGLPQFSPDLDVEPHPAPIAVLRARIADADAVAICSTQYASGFPGLLKNALDWLVSSFESIGKPVLVVSAAATSPEPAHGHLMEVLRTMMGMHLIDGGAHVIEAVQIDSAGNVSAPDALAAFAAGYRQLEGVCAEIAAAAAS